MRTLTKTRLQRLRMVKQRGVVLFFALIALLAISLAAVALIRSVDTSTMIAGNLAFKQASIGSGSSGVEVAMTWLVVTEAANKHLNVLMDDGHPFNNDASAAGYYSSVDPNFDLFDAANWTTAKSVLVGEDATGNTVNYIIQRMCRVPNIHVAEAGCLFSFGGKKTDAQNIPPPSSQCKGPGCPPKGFVPQLRITARATGPKNTISYVQAFVY